MTVVLKIVNCLTIISSVAIALSIVDASLINYRAEKLFLKTLSEPIGK